MLHNAAARQNNVPSESSFATKCALFGPKNVCPFQILDLTLYKHQFYYSSTYFFAGPLQIGESCDIIEYAEKEWKGQTAKAICIKKVCKEFHKRKGQTTKVTHVL